MRQCSAAVAAARAIQQANTDGNLRLRIGIHVGDVVVQGAILWATASTLLPVLKRSLRPAESHRRTFRCVRKVSQASDRRRFCRRPIVELTRDEHDAALEELLLHPVPEAHAPSLPWAPAGCDVRASLLETSCVGDWRYQRSEVTSESCRGLGD